ncbi:hypothetical protein SAMN05660649_00656, partial [Desulfotomaculum arcticum]
ERLAALETGQQETNKRLTIIEQETNKRFAAIEAAVNDLRNINRQTHKKIFTHLNAMWDDIKLLSTNEERSIR